MDTSFFLLWKKKDTFYVPRSKRASPVRYPISDGISSLNLLSCISNSTRPIILPSSVGIEPVNLLPADVEEENANDKGLGYTMGNRQ